MTMTKNNLRILSSMASRPDALIHATVNLGRSTLISLSTTGVSRTTNDQYQEA